MATAVMRVASLGIVIGLISPVAMKEFIFLITFIIPAPATSAATERMFPISLAPTNPSTLFIYWLFARSLTGAFLNASQLFAALPANSATSGIDVLLLMKDRIAEEPAAMLCVISAIEAVLEGPKRLYIAARALNCAILADPLNAINTPTCRFALRPLILLLIAVTRCPVGMVAHPLMEVTPLTTLATPALNPSSLGAMILMSFMASICRDVIIGAWPVLPAVLHLTTAAATMVIALAISLLFNA